MWLTAVVGIAGIWIGNGQRQVMQRQLDQMQTEGRPWVGMGFVGYPPDPVQLQFENGGKSPALNVHIKAFAWNPSDPDEHPVIPNARCLLDCKVRGVELLPGVPLQFVLLRPTGDVRVWIIGRADYTDTQGN